MAHDPNCKKCFGTGKVFVAGGPARYCNCFITGPAPKEGLAMQVKETLICRLCKKIYMTDLKDTLICDSCREKGVVERASKKKEEQNCIRRAVYDKALWAGVADGLSFELAHKDALLMVRQWPAMQAELDALIGEMG